MAKTYDFKVMGRPYSMKNSRVTDRKTGRTFINGPAKRWMNKAKRELGVQWGMRPPLLGCYSLEIVVVRKNRSHLNDNDAPITVFMDCLKGIVIHDDKPAHIGWVSGGTIIMPEIEEDFTLIRLVEMEPFTRPSNKD